MSTVAPLTGSVSSPIEAQQAGDLAARLVGSPEKVVNSIAVRGRDQVMLKVTVAEVRREIIKQMGVDLSASMNYGTAVVNFNNNNPFTALGRSLVSDNLASVSALTKGLPSVTATLRAIMVSLNEETHRSMPFEAAVRTALDRLAASNDGLPT